MFLKIFLKVSFIYLHFKLLINKLKYFMIFRNFIHLKLYNYIKYKIIKLYKIQLMAKLVIKLTKFNFTLQCI
jgi:hypothetical protein